MPEEQSEVDQRYQAVVERGKQALVDYQRVYGDDKIKFIGAVVEQLIFEGLVDDACAALVYWYSEDSRVHDDNISYEAAKFFTQTAKYNYSKKFDNEAVHILVDKAVEEMKTAESLDLNFSFLSVSESIRLPDDMRVEALRLFTEATKHIEDIDNRSTVQNVIWNVYRQRGKYREYATEVLDGIDGTHLVGVPALFVQIIDDMDRARDHGDLEELPKGAEEIFEQMAVLYERWQRRGLGKQFGEVIEDKYDERPELFAQLPREFVDLAERCVQEPEVIDLSEFVDERAEKVLEILNRYEGQDYRDHLSRAKRDILKLYPDIEAKDLDFLVSLVLTKDDSGYGSKEFKEIEQITSDWEEHRGEGHEEVAELIKYLWRYGNQNDFRKAVLAAILPRRMLDTLIPVRSEKEAETTNAILTIGEGRYLCPSAEIYMLESIGTGGCVVVYSAEGKRLLLKIRGKVGALCLDDMQDRTGRKFYRGVWYTPDEQTEEMIMDAFVRGENEAPFSGSWIPEKLVQDGFGGLYQGDAVLREADIAADEIRKGKWSWLTSVTRRRILSGRQVRKTELDDQEHLYDVSYYDEW